MEIETKEPMRIEIFVPEGVKDVGYYLCEKKRIAQIEYYRKREELKEIKKMNKKKPWECYEDIFDLGEYGGLKTDRRSDLKKVVDALELMKKYLMENIE